MLMLMTRFEFGQKIDKGDQSEQKNLKKKPTNADELGARVLLHRPVHHRGQLFDSAWKRGIEKSIIITN